MNEIVKYHNDLNALAFKGFSDVELKIFFAICSRLRDKGTQDVVFTFDQLKELTDEKKHYTVQEYADLMQEMYHKLIHLSFVYNDGKDIAGEFNIFQGYERSISQQTFTVSVSEKYLHFFNELTREFTRFELQEFVQLNGKYTKLLYRLLKQYRVVGHYSIEIAKLRELMDCPETYETKSMTNRVIEPAVNKLRKVYVFRNLTFKYSYRGRKAIRVIFDWDPEKIPGKEEPQIKEPVKKEYDMEEIRRIVAEVNEMFPENR